MVQATNTGKGKNISVLKKKDPGNLRNVVFSRSQNLFASRTRGTEWKVDLGRSILGGDPFASQEQVREHVSIHILGEGIK